MIFIIITFLLSITTFTFFTIQYCLMQQTRHGLLPVRHVIRLLSSLLTLNIYEWVTELLCTHNGTFILRFPYFRNLNRVILTSNPNNIEHFLKKKFSNYPKGPFFRDVVDDFLGDGIFSADGEIWQQQRKIAGVVFHSSKFKKMTTESLFQLVHTRLLPVLDDSVEKLVHIDLHEILVRLTFDSVCMISFGVNPGCLKPDFPEVPFRAAIENAAQDIFPRFVLFEWVWKTMRWLNLGIEKRIKSSIQEIDKFTKKVIWHRKKELDSESSSIGDKKEEKGIRSDLLTTFIKHRDKDGQAFSDKFLRDICVNFVIAGRDTSSVALSWFFWLIEKNPEVEERIIEEIYRVVGEKDEVKVKELVENGDVVFGGEELEKMEYLQAALSETLRLYPPLPVDNKEAIEDDIFPDGTIVKKGSKVVYVIYAMGRMEAIWGKDFEKFRPERWLRNGKFTSESAYKFTAFNGGPRLCLGKDFAYYQMKYVAASILYRYRVRVVEGHVVVPKLSLTLYMKHGLKVKLFRRDEAKLRNKYINFELV